MLWTTIQEHESNNDIIVAVMPIKPENSSLTTTYGLLFNKTYTILSTEVLKSGDRLIQLRNPSGYEIYIAN